jgi:hypothetical protein
MGSIHAVKMEYDLPDWEMGEPDRSTAGIVSPPRYRRWLWQEINLGKRVCYRRDLSVLLRAADCIVTLVQITGIRATKEHYMYANLVAVSTRN